MGNSGSRGGGGSGSSRGDVCRVNKSHDPSRPCPSGGEGHYSSHEVSYGGRIYSDKGRGDGCYDRTDKNYSTGSRYPSGNSSGKGGEGRGGGSGSSVNNTSGTSIYGEPLNKDTLSITKQRAIKKDFTKILRDLYPQDYSKHIDSWPSTLWGKEVIKRGDFQAIENFFVTEFVDILHKRYPHNYPANFKDWNSKNSQWGKDVILRKDFKAIGKWLPAYKKEVLEQQKVLKTDFVEILHRVYPEDYPMNFKDWNNIWGKQVIKRGDFEAIKKHLPSYKKQALEKEQNILFLVKDKSDVYLGGMSIGDYGVKLIIGGVANKITTLNLANNQIRDDGAKLLASSLSKGEMPNLKKLHLEGNKITDEGQDALINALKNETVQDVIITAITLYEKYQLNVSGNKEKQRSILENQLERAKAHGVDVDNVVVEKTAWGWIKNKTNFNINIAFGWTKCFISYDDIESFAGERLLAKASKRLSWANDVKDGVLCYFEAESEALLTESGVRDIKYQLLEVQETPELVGNIEAWYEHIY